MGQAARARVQPVRDTFAGGMLGCAFTVNAPGGQNAKEYQHGASAYRSRRVR
jgi:hypothetical protein